MANNNDDIKNVLLAINSFTPADAVLTVDSETKNTDIMQEGIRVTKEGIEEAWDTLEAPKAKEATAEADTEVTEHNSGEDVTLTVNTPTEIKVPAEQADMIANMLKLAGVEVGDKPAMDQPDMDMDSGDGEDLPMVIPTDDEEAPLMGACASEGEEDESSETEVKETHDKVCEDCGCQIDNPKPGCNCTHDSHDAKGDNWVKETSEMAEVEESIEKAWNENVLDDTNKENAQTAQTARILQARIREAMLKSQSAEEVSTEEFKEIARLARILQARIGGVTSGDAVTEGASKSKMIDDAESMSMGEFVEKYSAQGMSDEEAKQEYKEIMGEAIGKPVTEAVGQYADPLYDLIEELGSHQVVMDELIRYLDADQIKEFVSDFRRHHEMPAMDDENLPKEAIESTKESYNDPIMFKGKEVDMSKLDYDMQDISNQMFMVNAPVYYTDGTEVDDGDMEALESMEEFHSWVMQDYMDNQAPQSEGEQPMQEAFDKVDRITNLADLNIYDKEEEMEARKMSAEQLKDGLEGDIYHLMDKASDDFTDNDYIVDEMGDNFASMHLNADDATLSCYVAIRDLIDEDPADVLQTGQMCLKILGAQAYEANESKDNLDPQVNRIAELSGITNPVAQANPVAEAVSTTDLITKYQGSEVDVNDMNRLLKLSGMGELDESKLANAPAGTSMDEPTEFDKLPSEVGKGAGNSDYINRADGQGENPMGMHSSDVEESFNTALGEYRKFVAEGIMGKKTKKAKK